MTNDIKRALADHDGKKPYRGYASAAIWTLKQGVRNFSGKDVAFYARKLGITGRASLWCSRTGSSGGSGSLARTDQQCVARTT